MAKFLIATVPILGHVNPATSLAKELVRRGHEVAWYTGQRYKQTAEAAGALYMPWNHAGDYDDRDFDGQFPDRIRKKGIAKLKWDIRHLFIEPMPGQWKDLQDILEQFKADVILSDPAFLGVLPLALQGQGPRIAVFGILPLTISSRDTAPFGLGLPPGTNRVTKLRDRMLNRFVQKVVFGGLHKRVNRLLAEMNKSPLPCYFLDATTHLSDVFLQGTCESFEYPRSDLPEKVKFIGPIIPRRPGSFDPPNWWDEVVGSKRPVIHVTQGTVANEDFSRLLIPAIDALSDLDVLVIVTLGGRPLESLTIGLPANALVSTFINYHEFLPHVDIMITNGGYGGVHMALVNGVPIIAAGITEDKPEVNARLAWTGAGINLRTETPTREMIRRAVRTMLNDPSYKKNARRLQEDFIRYDAILEAGDYLERLASSREAD